jgi:hypothetical protein
MRILLLNIHNTVGVAKQLFAGFPDINCLPVFGDTL